MRPAARRACRRFSRSSASSSSEPPAGDAGVTATSWAAVFARPDATFSVAAGARALQARGVLATVLSCALVGIDAHPVHVEVDLAAGLPQTATVGLPDH